ncbi:hypothetical protein ACFJIY_04510 [Pimelobacter simplex]|uniref:hypothetical protein n=1 Tax=Nocardioides simplex TaxID=2045 RepID=UPI00366BFE6C
MSPTTEDLRTAIADELATLEPMTDVVGRARVAGRRRLRRRRTLRAGAAAAAVTVVAGLGYAAVDSDPTAAPDVAADATARSPRPADPRRTTAEEAVARAMASPRITEQAWLDAFAATWDALLPRRFGGVTLTREPGSAPLLRTASGTPRLDSWLSIGGYEGSRADQPGTSGCAGLRQVAAEADFRWDVTDCVDGTIAGELDYLADREFTVGGNQSDTPGRGRHGAGVLVVGDNFFLEWGVQAVGPDAEVGLTADEMATMLEDPLFLRLAELGTRYFAERPDEPSIVRQVDPTWPLS